MPVGEKNMPSEPRTPDSRLLAAHEALASKWSRK